MQVKRNFNWYPFFNDLWIDLSKFFLGEINQSAAYHRWWKIINKKKEFQFSPVLSGAHKISSQFFCPNTHNFILKLHSTESKCEIEISIRFRFWIHSQFIFEKNFLWIIFQTLLIWEQGALAVQMPKSSGSRPN